MTVEGSRHPTANLPGTVVGSASARVKLRNVASWIGKTGADVRLPARIHFEAIRRNAVGKIVCGKNR